MCERSRLLEVQHVTRVLNPCRFLVRKRQIFGRREIALTPVRIVDVLHQDAWLWREAHGTRAAKEDSGIWKAYIRRGDQNLVAPGILLKMWKQKTSRKGAKVTYSEAEQLLFSYLREHRRITLNKFYKLASINRFNAERILIKLVGWNVLEFVVEEKGYWFEFAK